ncbi:hypothetical protein Prubr_20700 [Polymorphospora rubra]|uniref:Uncharacterized protein n=1 Tax=Polymorphospora rubra TaxID=338584 RepID=A0A810MYL0_9ACTN|nr:hypothetical protein Prubr_20700 [Polymorphospora rubra]
MSLGVFAELVGQDEAVETLRRAAADAADIVRAAHGTAPARTAPVGRAALPAPAR